MDDFKPMMMIVADECIRSLTTIHCTPVRRFHPSFLRVLIRPLRRWFLIDKHATQPSNRNRMKKKRIAVVTTPTGRKRNIDFV
jgi:hypothetical protein